MVSAEGHPTLKPPLENPGGYPDVGSEIPTEVSPVDSAVVRVLSCHVMSYNFMTLGFISTEMPLNLA